MEQRTWIITIRSCRFSFHKKTIIKILRYEKLIYRKKKKILEKKNVTMFLKDFKMMKTVLFQDHINV